MARQFDDSAGALRGSAAETNHGESEPETRFLVVLLFLLGGLGRISGTGAVVPAYVIGLALAPILQRNTIIADRLRTVAFAWFVRAMALECRIISAYSNLSW